MLPHPAMSTHHPLTKYARLWLALAPNLLLVALALFWPHDCEDRGPALLSVAGHQHFIFLHFPVAILMLVPFFEIWDRHAEAGLTIRRLSLLGAVSIWATCLFGLLEAHFNGGDYTGLDQHLWLGIAASFVAAGAWLLIFQSWRVRVIAQLAAVGPSPELDETMRASVARSRPYSFAIWVALLSAALLGVLKPGAPAGPADDITIGQQLK